jgi:hypothetical protein
MNWTTPAELKAQVQKWWDRGELLSALVEPSQEATALFPRRLRFKGPTSSETAESFAEIRTWIASLQKMAYFRVGMREFKHRVLGKNSIPAEVWLDSLDDALQVIGKRRDANRFLALLEMTRKREPQLLPWLQKRTLLALELSPQWEQLLNIIAWLKEHPRPQIYLRQVDVAGVHSKFIESNRSVLAELLDAVLPSEFVDETASGITQFSRRFGFRVKPVRIRFRMLDAAHALLPGGGDQDITVDATTFASLNPKVTRVFITENEINFLSFPQIKDSMVIFGSGYGFEALEQADWLFHCQIHYWGDIDTHGFAILSSARARFPHIQSLLMDEQTLLAHSQLVGVEDTPHRLDVLPNLTAAEQALYRGLREHRWHQNLRLEQEHISWAYASAAIEQASVVIEQAASIRL